MIAAVTGANGFIGCNLVHALAQNGWRVRALTRRGFQFESELAGIEPMRVDYSADRELAAALGDAAVVFHLAGATRAASDRALWEANVGLTCRVLRATPPSARIVFVSSQAAAGAAPSPDRPRTEEQVPEPVGQYGRSKLEAERLVAKRGGSVIVRPAAVYGPRDKDFLQLFRLARRGVALHAGNRDGSLSIVHVDDLVDALLLAATNARVADRSYFVAGDVTTTWRELFTAVAGTASRRISLDLQLPNALVSGAARLGDVYARLTGDVTLLTTHKAELGGPRHWVCSNARAKHELGFSPSVELRAGLRQTWEWYLQHGWIRP